MPRKKTVAKNNIQDFLANYDPKVLSGALDSFENGLGWALLQSFARYQSASHAGMAVLFAQQTGKQFESCASAAKAEVLNDLSENFIAQLKTKLEGQEGVVEFPRPQEQ